MKKLTFRNGKVLNICQETANMIDELIDCTRGKFVKITEENGDDVFLFINIDEILCIE